MSTATEQGHAHVEEDGGDEGGPGQTAYTSLAALLTAWKHKQTKRYLDTNISFEEDSFVDFWMKPTHPQKHFWFAQICDFAAMGFTN